MSGRPSRRGLDRMGFVSGVVVTVVVYGVLLGAVVYSRGHAAAPQKENLVYVDAQLVRFGKPRDLSFLPHVKAQPKVAEKPKGLKFTDNPDKPVVKKPDEEKPDEKALQAHKDLIRKMAEEDDRATQAALEEGSLTGTRGGTAAVASGDPFVLAVTAAITEKWAVPSMLTPGELAKLKAVACLKIGEDGSLVEFKIKEPSGNDLFDGSLNSTLGSIKELVKPYGPFAKAALNYRLCAEFTKQ